MKRMLYRGSLPALPSLRRRFVRLRRSAAAAALALLLFASYIALHAAPAAQAEDSPFAFSGSMSEDVLRAYLSRAVTHQELCGGAYYSNPILEEDIRMLRRVEAKYIGRAAMFAWTGLNYDAVEAHMEDAGRSAATVHAADPEIILQAGLYEIAHKSLVDATPIPAWVFEAFGLPAEDRCFRHEEMQFPAGHEYRGLFDGAGVPYIARTETQMWFYYWICRYIDLGFEAFHLGQTELMAGNDPENYRYWDLVTTMGRAYGREHARRGVALFDAHAAMGSGGMKIGNRLILDVQGACLYPVETAYNDGVYECRIGDYREKDCSYQRIGRSDGGEHPLGFTVESNYTILEFDNFGNNGNFGVETPGAIFSWGFDDITWFASQPESYRNRFLLECDAYLKTHNLDPFERQVYFLQPATRRVIVPDPAAVPSVVYTPGDRFHGDFMLDYLETDEYAWNHGKANDTYINEDGSYTIETRLIYRANRTGDGCPNGFNQEDTIRRIFLGEDAPEDPSLTAVVLPARYADQPDGGATYPSASAVSPMSTAASPDSDKPFSWLVPITASAAIAAGAAAMIVLRRRRRRH